MKISREFWELLMSSKVFVPQGTNQTLFNPQLQHFDYICVVSPPENGRSFYKNELQSNPEQGENRITLFVNVMIK